MRSSSVFRPAQQTKDPDISFIDQAARKIAKTLHRGS